MKITGILELYVPHVLVHVDVFLQLPQHKAGLLLHIGEDVHPLVQVVDLRNLLKDFVDFDFDVVIHF